MTAITEHGILRPMHDPDTWHVYIVRCADGTLYTGIAKDVPRRIAEHNNDDRLGAKYTRSRRPVTLVHREAGGSRSEALRRELAIKRMSRAAKDRLVARSSEATSVA